MIICKFEGIFFITNIKVIFQTKCKKSGLEIIMSLSCSSATYVYIFPFLHPLLFCKL